jgi:hypothetical protein
MATNPPNRPTDRLAVWRHNLDARPILADPHVPPASTLAGMADRLTAVSKMLATLSDDRPEERDFGVAVAGMAADFACKVLDHLGFGCDDDPLSAFLNLKMAEAALTNLRAAVNGHLEDWRRGFRDQAQSETTAEMAIGPERPAAAPEGAARQQTEPAAASGLIIAPDTFTVTYKGKPGFFGNSVAFRLLARLAESPGIYVALNILKWDVWHDEDISDGRVQRQISNIRTLLRHAEIEGVEIDGEQPQRYRLILR